LATGNLKYILATGNIGNKKILKYISAIGNIGNKKILKYNSAIGNLKYISATGIALDCVLKLLFFT